jgi:hypothetical protein
MNNFFAPLRDLPMEVAEPGSERNCTKTPERNESPSNAMPTPIALTSEANLISLPRELERAVSEQFFRNTATGTRITTTSMVDYNAIQTFLTEKNLHFITFYTEEEKRFKAVIRHLPGNISVNDITVALQEIAYDVISVRQMTAKRPTPEGGRCHTHLPPPLPRYTNKESESPT